MNDGTIIHKIYFKKAKIENFYVIFSKEIFDLDDDILDVKFTFPGVLSESIEFYIHATSDDSINLILLKYSHIIIKHYRVKE